MPNEMNVGGRQVVLPVATPVTPFGVSPSLRGLGLPPEVYTLLQDRSFNARGVGRFSLTTADRFPRGPRMSGQQGTIDMVVMSGAAASGVRTLCYLTDDPASPSLVILLGIDGSNRPFVRITTPTTASYVAATGVLTLTGNMTDTAATGVLTLALNLNDGDTVTIGTKTYTFEASLTDVDGNVKIDGVSASNTIDNLIAAITLTGTPGTDYALSMTLHPTATAAAGAGDTMDVTAKAAGVAGNNIVTTESTATVRMSWGAATLTGGLNDTITIDGKTYSFQTVLTNLDGNVLIGGSASLSIDNLIAAITLTGTPGTDYATATTLHPSVTGAAGAGDTMDATAKTPGVAGNSIATTKVAANAAWGGATLSGGAGSVAAAETTPTGGAIADNTRLSIRMAWDSENLIPGETRQASLQVNGVAVPVADWSTDPTSPWVSFQPTWLVTGEGSGGLDHDGNILDWQGSSAVLP